MKAWVAAAALAALACVARPASAQAISDAVKANDLVTVKRLVETDAAQAQLPDKDKNAPLHLAAAGGFEPVAEYLLEKVTFSVLGPDYGGWALPSPRP